MELVIQKKIDTFGNFSEKKEGFFLPLVILKRVADLKKGHPISVNGILSAGCNINVGGEMIDIKKINRNDPELIQAVKEEIRDNNTTYQSYGIALKIVNIPDDVSWKIICSENQNEVVVWNSAEEGDEAYAHQHPNENEHFHLPLPTLENYVNQNHDTHIVYTMGTKEAPKRYTQFLNQNGVLIATKNLSRKNPKMLRSIKESPQDLVKHVVIKKVWRKPVKHLKLTDSGSFEIILPDV
jgi:hypothetical protein